MGEVSIYRTLATIEAEESALRYCRGCGGTFAQLHFQGNELCQSCMNPVEDWEVDERVNGVDEAQLTINQAAIVRLIRNHRAEFDVLIQDESRTRGYYEN